MFYDLILHDEPKQINHAGGKKMVIDIFNALL